MKTRCTRFITRHFFSNKVVDRWNLLDQRTVDASSLNAFQNCLTRVRDDWMGFLWTSELSGGDRIGRGLKIF